MSVLEIKEGLVEEIISDADFLDFELSVLTDTPPASPSQPSPRKEAVAAVAAEKYVVFHLDNETYGVNSKSVSEVTGSLPITPLPNAPEWLLGLANLRGEIISVINLRKLWRKETPTPAKTRLIVFSPKKTDAPIAFLVDKIHEMTTLSSKDINFTAEDFTDAFPACFGKATYKFQPLYLLDADKILSSLKIQNAKKT